MSEKVIIRQNRESEKEVLVSGSRDTQAREFQPVTDIRAMTPHHVLMASLGLCMAEVLHTHARNHQLDLSQVEIELEFVRHRKDESETQPELGKRQRLIRQKVKLISNLEPEICKKIFLISRRCAVYRLLQDGVALDSELIECD